MYYIKVIKTVLICILVLNVGLSQNLIPHLDGDLYGYCNEEGNISILPQYNEVRFFKANDFAWVK